MLTNVVDSIICSQFNHAFGYARKSPEASRFRTEPDRAMLVKFSLSPDYDREEGYRNLSILIFGGGANYIGVYGKLDWNVIAREDLTDDDPPCVVEGRDYVKGETPWVLVVYHDSCWRGGVHGLLWQYRDRISTIDSLFNGDTGWYSDVQVTAQMRAELRLGSGASGRVKLEDLEFQLPALKN